MFLTQAKNVNGACLFWAKLNRVICFTNALCVLRYLKMNSEYQKYIDRCMQMEETGALGKMLCRIVIEIGEDKSREILEGFRSHPDKQQECERLSGLLNRPLHISCSEA